MAVFGNTVSFNPPPVPERYDPRFIQEIIEFLEELVRSVYLKSRHVEIYAPQDAGGREPLLILRSPNGTRWKITVDDAGVISATDIGDIGL